MEHSQGYVEDDRGAYLEAAIAEAFSPPQQEKATTMGMDFFSGFFWESLKSKKD